MAIATATDTSSRNASDCVSTTRGPPRANQEVKPLFVLGGALGSGGSVIGIPVAATALRRCSDTPVACACWVIQSKVTSDKRWSAKPPPMSECTPRNHFWKAPPTSVAGKKRERCKGDWLAYSYAEKSVSVLMPRNGTIEHENGLALGYAGAEPRFR
jgi:hypothetical protein